MFLCINCLSRNFVLVPDDGFMKNAETCSTVHTLQMYCLKMSVAGGLDMSIHSVQGGVPAVRDQYLHIEFHLVIV
jgi:hypothetical protein